MIESDCIHVVCVKEREREREREREGGRDNHNKEENAREMTYLLCDLYHDLYYGLNIFIDIQTSKIYKWTPIISYVYKLSANTIALTRSRNKCSHLNMQK